MRTGGRGAGGPVWGGGLYLNYLFTAVWVADVLCWWRGLAWYAARPRWLDLALHGFLARVRESQRSAA